MLDLPTAAYLVEQMGKLSLVVQAVKWRGECGVWSEK
jgi:hypothetical protein